MGYSCTVLAAYSYDEMMKQLDQSTTRTSNGWTYNGSEYFVQRGREQHDGAVTGAVFKTVNGLAHPAGGVRIEQDGSITRWPTSTKIQRQTAFQNAKEKYRKEHAEPALT